MVRQTSRCCQHPCMPCLLDMPDMTEVGEGETWQVAIAAVLKGFAEWLAGMSR